MAAKHKAHEPAERPRWLRRTERGLLATRLLFNLVLIGAFGWAVLVVVPVYRAEQERFPALAEAWDHLAEKRLDEAEHDFRAMLTLYPDELRAQLGLLEAEAASEDFPSALERAHRLSAEAAARRTAAFRERVPRMLLGAVSPSAAPMHPAEPYARLIRWLPWEGAEGILKEAGKHALELDPDNPWGAVATGRTLLDRNHPREAVPVIQRGFARNPGPEAEMLLNWLLCEAFSRIGNWAEAVEAIHRAIAIDPDNDNLRALRVISEGFLAIEKERARAQPEPAEVPGAPVE